MKTIYPIVTIVLTGIVVWFVFFDQKPILPENNIKDDIARLRLEHVWDSIEKSEYLLERVEFGDTIKILRDSIKYKSLLVKKAKENFIKKEKELERSTTENLSVYFDGFAGKKEGETVKEIDSVQLVNSAKLFNEAEGSRDIINGLTDELNYQTIVSTKYEEALDSCDKKLIATYDTLDYRNNRDKKIVKDNDKKHKKELKKYKRENTWTKIIAGTVVGVVVVLSIFAAGA